MKNCVVYLSHLINKNIINQYLELCDMVKDEYDVYFIFDSNSNSYELTKQYSDQINFIYINSKEDFSKLGYKRFHDSDTIGIAYFFLQYFIHILGYNQYDNYWFIEYDVKYLGDWKNLLKDIDSNINHDLVSQYVYMYNEDEDKHWYWYYNEFTLNPKYYNYDKNNLVRSFNPFFRLSKESSYFIHNELNTRDICGHYEYILATLLYNNGFTLFSLNNNGSLQFTTDEYNHKYSNCNTFRATPEITNIDVNLNGKNMLYHPIK